MADEIMILADPIETLNAGMRLLPDAMNTESARVLVLAICIQESGFRHRAQVLQNGRKGPARGFPQFEIAGVAAVLNHTASRYWARSVLRQSGMVADSKYPSARAVCAAMETDDALAMAFARLLLFTDPRSLPEFGDEARSWAYYIRNWKPGRPHRNRWASSYSTAQRLLLGLLD